MSKRKQLKCNYILNYKKGKLLFQSKEIRDIYITEFGINEGEVYTLNLKNNQILEYQRLA